MTKNREATCSERIASHLASRAEDVRKMFNAQSGRVCRHCGEAIEQDEDEVWIHTDDADARCDGSGEWADVEPDEDYHEDSLYEFGLGISRKVLLRFDMSTGGPADWLEITCDEVTNDLPGTNGLDVERVTYHFADWFDHAEETVPEDSPLWQLAEWVAETESQS